MKRRSFIKGVPVAGIMFTQATGAIPSIMGDDKADEPFELDETTIDMLQDKMKTGKLTSKKITQLYLNRINAIDKVGPKLNAIIELNPEAISIAEKMDAERKSGKIRGPMHGIPVLVKDNINTGDKMMTTAGALALLGNYATNDAFIVKKLRAAGAVILGKNKLQRVV